MPVDSARRRSRARSALLRISLCVFALAHPFAAHAQDDLPPEPSLTDDTPFDAALDLATRNPLDGMRALERFATAHPDDPAAPDALAAAAELAEEQLHRPDEALALYQRLIERHPDHRLVLRARARRDFLAAGLKSGVSPLAEYEDILSGYGARPAAESIARMEQLLVAHPDFALADRALLWIARSVAEQGRLTEAEARFQAIERRWPGTAVAREALLGRADLLLDRHQAQAAGPLLRELLSAPEPALADAARQRLQNARRLLWRDHLFVIALVYLALWLVVMLRSAWGRLLPRPFELNYYAPIALLIVLAARSGPPGVFGAALLIASGGLVIIWLTSAAARERFTAHPLRVRLVLQLGATCATLFALFYAAVYRMQLIDFLIETVRNGPDR